MKPRRLLWLAVASYLVFLLFTLPAHWGALVLSKLSQQRIQLVAAEGTLWHGRCHHLQVEQNRIDNLSWDWHVLPLLWLTLEAELHWNQDAHALLAWRGQHIALREADAQLPLTWIAPYFPAAQEYGLGGELRLVTPDLIWDNQLNGKATLTWRRASTSRLPVNPLGDYQIQLTADKHGTIFNVQTLSGVLNVSGTGRWLPHDRLRLNGSLRPDPARQAEFSSLLTLTGNQPDSQGTYRLAF